VPPTPKPTPMMYTHPTSSTEGSPTSKHLERVPVRSLRSYCFNFPWCACVCLRVPRCARGVRVWHCVLFQVQSAYYYDSGSTTTTARSEWRLRRDGQDCPSPSCPPQYATSCNGRTVCCHRLRGSEGDTPGPRHKKQQQPEHAALAVTRSSQR
jgi:hypothetical protein